MKYDSVNVNRYVHTKDLTGGPKPASLSFSGGVSESFIGSVYEFLGGFSRTDVSSFISSGDRDKNK